MNIPKIVHQANKAYCEELGDFSQVNWENAENDIKRSASNGVANVIANPGLTAKDSHDSWLAQKEADGYVYDKVKNFENKTHPCMVAFEELPEEQQVKDALFIAITQVLSGATVETTDVVTSSLAVRLEGTIDTLNEQAADQKELIARLNNGLNKSAIHIEKLETKLAKKGPNKS